MTAPALFVVSFVHAHRAFKCVRVENAEASGPSSPGAHWVVTLEGRTVWSFPATPGEDRESVEAAVGGWWDAAAQPTH